MAEAADERYRTIPLRPTTWERLRDYKMSGATWDEVLNSLMDAVPVERVAQRIVREHKARLRTFRGRDVRDLRKK